MPTAEQPAATGKHVTPTRVIPTRVIPMGMDVPVSLPMMPLYAIVMGDSGRHKHQRANYSRDEQILCKIQTSHMQSGQYPTRDISSSTLICREHCLTKDVAAVLFGGNSHVQ